MTDLRTAAQQALEALENASDIMDSWAQKRQDDAITALRAALADPVQEPVAMLWQHRETGRTRVLMPNERTATDVAAAWDVVGPLYLAPPHRPAELVQEPVAKVELMTSGGNAGLATRIVEIDDHLRERLRPGQLLYTAPPQSKPLTEEEIDSIWDSEKAFADIYAIARAIERAHGIMP